MSTRPRAFRLDTPGTVTVAADAPEAERTRQAGSAREAASVLVTEEPDDAILSADGVPVAPAAPRRAPWGTLFASAVAGLVSLGIGLGIERLVADLFAVAPSLGWVAAGLAALAVLSLVAVVAREIRGVLRERRIESLRTRTIAALAVKDEAAARALAAEVAAFYDGRHGPAMPGPSVADADTEIMDASDRLALAERTLVAPLDEAAKRAVAATAKQVSVVTALSPRAIVDVAFVVYAAATLLRRIAGIYGGRPGFFGFLRLARSAFNHLAVTGGVAIGDSLLQQMLGLGVAARISAKFGEGVLNGLMTARFGLAAIEVCRPLPFIREMPPRIGDVAGELLSSRSDDGR